MDEKGLLEKRKNRCIVSILSYKEREVDRFLVSEDAALAFRKLILDEINEFYSIALDMLENNINEEYLEMLEMLEDIHSAIVGDDDG